MDVSKDMNELEMIRYTMRHFVKLTLCVHFVHLESDLYWIVLTVMTFRIVSMLTNVRKMLTHATISRNARTPMVLINVFVKMDIKLLKP